MQKSRRSGFAALAERRTRCPRDSVAISVSIARLWVDGILSLRTTAVARCSEPAYRLTDLVRSPYGMGGHDCWWSAEGDLHVAAVGGVAGREEGIPGWVGPSQPDRPA
jgi:hypothetical protein